jgi:hypothetical protein
MTLKRVNYFTHQFLREEDFKEEQEYHIKARHRHNRYFHSWGVLEGLEVRKKGETEIVVEPGFAVDKDGCEIEILEEMTRTLTATGQDKEIYISISSVDEQKEEDRVSAGGVEGYVRTTELVEIHEQRREHVSPDAVVLARIRVGPQGHIEAVDMSSAVRKIGHRSGSSGGWMRMPFKPVRVNSFVINPEGAGGRAAEEDFSIDEANAYCGRNGARGSMQIPLPPGATRVSGFRIAGSTQGELIARLFRTGWNVSENTGEKTAIVEEVLREKTFHKEVEIDVPLDEWHALSVSIRTNNQSEIWLLAVRFD